MRARLPRATLLCAALFFPTLSCGSTCPEATSPTTPPTTPRVAEARVGGGGEGDPFPEGALGARMRELRERLAGMGFRSRGALFRGLLAARELRSVPLAVPAGRCVAVVGLSSRSLLDLDLHLYSADGELLAEDVERDNHPSLVTCAGEEAEARVLGIDAYQGSGEALLGSFESEGPQIEGLRELLGGRPDLDRPGLDPVAAALDRASLPLRRRRYWENRPPLRLPMDQEGSLLIPMPVQRGRCYAALLAVPASMGGASLHLLDERERERARGGAGEEGLRFCASADEELRLELRAAGGGVAWLGRYEARESEAGDARAEPPPIPAGAPAAGADPRSREILRVELARREARRVSLRLPAGCGRVQAILGPGLRAVSFRREGVEAEELSICSERPRSLGVTLLAVDGQGEARLRFLSVEAP